MRNYATVRPQFWAQGTGKKLRDDRDARLMALYLMSAPSSTMTGIYYLPFPLLAHELGMTTEGAWKALRRLIDEGFCAYDEGDELVFVVNMAREQVGETLSPKDKRSSAVIKELEKYRKHPFFGEFVRLYGEAYSLPFEAPSKPLAMPLRSQDQDQEQDQDQKYSSESRGDIEREPVPSKPKPDPSIDQVFAYWRDKTWGRKGPAPKLDAKRRSRIAARLRDGFTVEDLCRVVDGALLSEFHVSGGHLGVQTVFRDREVCEQHIRRLESSSAQHSQEANTITVAERNRRHVRSLPEFPRLLKRGQVDEQGNWINAS